MSRGVVLIALGNPLYGCYAHQLCLSLKAVDPTIKVTIATAGQTLSHLSFNKFDNIISPVPDEYRFTKGMPDYLKAKTYLYELSPYDETIFIDADVIWLPQKPISNLFEEFKDINFTMSNRGVEPIHKALDGFIHWASPKLLMEEYKFNPLQPLYNLASEFIYFKKCKEVKRLFKEAQKVFDNPPEIFKKFAQGMPDELAFEIAMLKTGIYPHKAPYIPFYWEQFERKMKPIYEIYKEFYAYSLGGNVNTSGVDTIYNNLAQHYNKTFGVNGYFPAKNKKSIIPERQTL